MELINYNDTMTSLEIAELTGKEHNKILRDIRDEIEKLEKQGIRAETIFGLGEYLDKNNQSRPMYNLTKEGVLQLAARYDAVVRFKLIEKVTKGQQQLSPAQYLLQQAQWMVEAENRLNTVENGINDIQKEVVRLGHNQRREITSNHLTVIAYANMKGISPKTYHSSSIGRKATKICREKRLQTGTVVDSKYGLINTYPSEVLDEIFFG
ncbi:Rha family transcriptional regulator [Leptotrichia shahii]|uniref:Rha family transcriptional regulator n=1 Tax=Leptotrichia shahii TaxID=157691 RepID=UPI0028D2FCCB|nr:Rha family transcriptional regulator [Leptotrichia shahii]